MDERLKFVAGLLEMAVLHRRGGLPAQHHGHVAVGAATRQI
ncbi:hypothetical protein [Bradyrhizobium sp.]